MSDTPETDAFYANLYAPNVPADMIEIACGDERRKMQSFERQRNEAREAFAIATDQLVQVQGELRQAREENARLRAKMTWLAGQLTDHPCACQWLDDTISELFTP